MSTRVHRQRRQVFREDWLEPIAAPARYDEQRESAQQPGYVIDKDIFDAEDDRGPDDGVGDSRVDDRLLYLGFPSEVG